MAPPIFNVLLFFTISFFSIASAKPRSYIIHMDASAMPKPFSGHHDWYLATIASISETSQPISKHIYSYTSSINGFSAILTDSELEAIKKTPGYISSTRDRLVKIHTTHTSQFLGLSPDSGAWPAANYGDDIIIGLIDTGVWPESESYSDEGLSPIPDRWKGKCESSEIFNSSLCNKKLIGASFYNKGFFANEPEMANVTVNSTRDTDGHGTHTSSTAAGNFVEKASYFGYAYGTSKGMAPRARIAMYKAIWNNGVYESDVLAAVDQAIHDGVDILSLSLTLAEDDLFLEDDSIAIASFSATAKGIFVVAAAGNDGPNYFTLVNGAPWLLTVGAGTVDRRFGGILTLGDQSQISFFTLFAGNFSMSQKDLVFLNGCGSVQEMKKYKNQIIVCKDNLSLSDQYENAQSANVAAIFITDITDLDYYSRSSFPSAFINVEEGGKVINYIQNSNDPKATLQFQKTHIGTKPAPMVAGYSGRGPFGKCKYVLKPDIIAPGSSILASWSPISSVTKVGNKALFSNFNLDSGTSMATPHVAGVAALVKKLHPDWSLAAIRSAIITSANPLDNTKNPIKDEADVKIPEASPLDIGAGHVDPNKAIEPGLIYDATTQDYINFLCAMKLTKKQIKIITRLSNFSCENISVLDLNYPSFIINWDESNSKPKGEVVVHEFQRIVTNVGEGISNYTAKLTSMNGLKVSVEPQILEFKKNEKVRYKLRIEGPKSLKEDLVYGTLSWVHDGGKYIVRSPIVAIQNFVP